jgi:hypothetical protein
MGKVFILFVKIKILNNLDIKDKPTIEIPISKEKQQQQGLKRIDGM